MRSRRRFPTIAACAKAFGLSVHDLHTLPVERLLQRLRQAPASNGDDRLHRLFQQAIQPELRAWLPGSSVRALKRSRQTGCEPFKSSARTSRVTCSSSF